jgi:hypothetical protein
MPWLPTKILAQRGKKKKSSEAKSFKQINIKDPTHLKMAM